MAKSQKAHPVAESIKQPVGASTLAELEQHTTTAAVRAARPAGLNTGTSTNFSGQYLYDRFIGDSESVMVKADISRMDIVRGMVKAVDSASFKQHLADFVGIAKGYLDNAIKRAKEAGKYDEKNPGPEIAQCQARYKTCQNQQTIMRVAYGALKFAEDHLTANGYDVNTTGFNLMAVVGKKALEAKGIKWDGSKAVTPEVKKQRAHQKEEANALAVVMETNPKREGETRAQYFERIDDAVNNVMKQQREEHNAEIIAKLVADFRAKAGPLLPEILDALLSQDQGEQEPAEPDNEPEPAIH